MPSTNKTSNYNLNQWQGNEYLKREDFNTDNAIIDDEIKNVNDKADGKISKSLATAASQFLVSSGIGQWAAKTISETKTLLGLGNAAYTDSSAYATAAQGIKADNAATQADFNTHLVDAAAHGINTKVNASEFNAHLSDYAQLANKIENGSSQTPSLGFGMNSVIRIPEVATSPVIDFEGISYVNLFGSDGNCEDISKWGGSNATLTLNSTAKVDGQNGIKITIGSSGNQGVLFKYMTPTLKVSTCYMVSAYVKNGNSNGVFISVSGNAMTSDVTQTLSMQRVCGKWKTVATELTYIMNVGVKGTEGMYGFVDNIMLIEIPQWDYDNLTTDQLMAKYSYGEGYTCLENPLFENKRNNLIENGNTELGIGYWTVSNPSTTSITVENNKFKLVTTSPYGYATQRVKVKPNTNCYLKANASGGWIFADNLDLSTIVGNLNTTFNTGSNSELVIMLHDNGVAGTYYFDSIMLVEGTTAPSEYISCDLQRFVIEGKFATGDKVHIENKKVTGERWTKHALPLYGKDYNWQYKNNPSGYKIFTMPNLPGIQSSNAQYNLEHVLINPNGYPVQQGNTNQLSEGFEVYSGDNSTYMSIPNSVTGFTDAVNPNDNESKIPLNGWIVTSANSRYIGFVSIVDGSIPAGATKTTASSASSTGQKVINFTDASWVLSGGVIAVKNSIGGWSTYQVASKSNNTVTMIEDIAVAINSGAEIFKCDNGTTDNSLATWCSQNVAPGFKGYQLHYKLTNLEPITDINTHINGEIWDLVPGDNYHRIDSGIVLSEVANPVYYSGNQSYYINHTIAALKDSILKNKVETIRAIYKNGIDITHLCIMPLGDSNAYGKQYATIPATIYDPNATYTVDYQILKTLHAQSFGSLSMTYKQSVLASLTSHSKALDQKQKQDSALDDIVDLSMYETQNWSKNDLNDCFVCRAIRVYYYNPSEAQVNIYVPFTVKKKIKPRVTLQNVSVRKLADNGAGSLLILSDFYFQPQTVWANEYGFMVKFVVRAGDSANYLINNGCEVKFDWVANCRGRI